MVFKKMKSKMLSILLAAAVTVTAVPSVPVMAMPENKNAENEEEVYVSETEPASDDLEYLEQDDSVEELSEEVSEPVSEELLEKLDVNVRAVGSNGILYDDVAYLSVQAYNSLSEDAQEVYMEMCDSIMEWRENGEDVNNIVIAVDEDGELSMYISMPLQSLYTEAAQQVADSLTGENLDEIADIQDESGDETDADSEDTGKEESGNDADAEDKEGSENDADTEDKEKSENDADAEDKEGSENDTDAEDKEGSENDTDTEGKTDADDSTNTENIEDEDNESDSTDLDENADNEEAATDSENSEEALDEEIGEAEEPLNSEVEEVEIEECIIAENLELAAAYNDGTQYLEEVPVAELDTLHTNKNYFYNQLSSNGKMFYNSGKKVWVDEKKADATSSLSIGYTLKTSKKITGIKLTNAIVDSISALVNTYPNSFNWMDLSKSLSAYYTYHKSGGASYNVSVSKSKYYSSSLETQATNKVNTLVDAAVKDAVKNYPANPTYGIIRYLDKWVCENNYYNDIGTETSKNTTEQYYYCHSAYGILLKGYGVCESYALAMTRLLDAAGIRNQYIVGSAGGGHAWNYVQMPDNKWYMLDSTWNDSGSTSNRRYLLVCNDGIHEPEGRRYVSGNKFKFEKLSTTSFIEPDGQTIALKPKEKYNMTVKDSYYSKMVTEWSSDDTKIAKVSKDGRITAGSKTGQTTIIMKMAFGTYAATVYVYKVANLTFSENGKTSYTNTYAANPYVYDDYVWFDPVWVTIKVNQNNRTMSAAELQKCASLPITASSSKTAVATVGTPTLTGDTIGLYVYPQKVGKSKITVKFAGKSASYTLNVKYELQDEWFTCESDSNPEGYDYTGKAIKPKVTKAASSEVNKIGKAAKYKVTYVNNKNAGNATVKIIGTGNYAGEVTKTFKINGVPLDGEVQFISCTESKVYNGAGQEPKTKVKVGKKTLKQGSDYVLVYKDSAGNELNDLPKDTGDYTVGIKGNNYSISTNATMPFTIKSTNISKMKVTCPSSIKVTGSDLIPAVKEKIKVKIGKNIIEEGTDYTVTFCDSNGTPLVSQQITEKGTYKVVFTPKGNNVLKTDKKETIIKTLKVK
ncbi:MAG: hypothetical protein J1D87_09675 [Lachnospiraceae bacterium]|nr:hypothetical protein [Lachnospiraceae bacterium]